MGEFEDTLFIAASPDQVFGFVADVRNLPRYLPTTHAAQPSGHDRVRVQGEAKGHAYEADGFLTADDRARRLEWGADEGYYSGWLTVQPENNGSAVTVHLSLRDRPGGSGEGGPSPADVQDGIKKGLESIRNHCEGGGGKVEPAAAT